MICQGTAVNHCCWLGRNYGGVCAYLRDDGQGSPRRWVCTLRESLGSWPAVHIDPRYLANVKPALARLGVDCGDWPRPNEKCAACGEVG